MYRDTRKYGYTEEEYKRLRKLGKELDEAIKEGDLIDYE